MPETTSAHNLDKPTSFTITFDDNNNEKVSDNLQEAFLKFKKSKEDRYRPVYIQNDQNPELMWNDLPKEEIDLFRKNQLKSRKARNDPERMWNLRMKFMEHAKKYFGIPYAKKYFPEGTPEHSSPLFLDCCGLVRRVMRDLEKEFGFRIGGGNQAYMFDTLPKTIHDIKSVKPGDLVFISGIYYNPKMRKQRHNMTHVEILTAEGEQTIGARWNNGKVQYFDSYKFIASSFHSPTYYFKSIDTWLLGICRSFCPKHQWPYKIYRPNKRSIFANTALKKKKKTKKPKSNKNGQNKLKKKKKIKKKSSESSITPSLAKPDAIDNQQFQVEIGQPLSEILDEDEAAESEKDDNLPPESNISDYNNILEEEFYEDDDDFEEDGDSYDDDYDEDIDAICDDMDRDLQISTDNKNQTLELTSSLSMIKYI